MAVLLALVSEVASVRNRLDTHERLQGSGVAPTAQAVEAFAPDAGTDAAREVWRDAYIRRLFRVITEDVESLSRKAGTADAAS